MSRHIATFVLFVGALFSADQFLFAQQVQTATPFPSATHGFSEMIGFSGAVQGPGFFARWGGFPAAAGTTGVTPFGGVQGGFGLNGGGLNANFGFMAGQGSNSMAGMQTPMVTTMNGFMGSISDTSQSPFVISGGVPWQQQMNGQIPRQPGRDSSFRVVPAPDNLAAPQQSSAAQSVAQIRRQQQAAEQAQQQEALGHFDRARAAVADGKPGVARIYYQMALRRATGDLKQQVQDELSRLGK